MFLDKIVLNYNISGVKYMGKKWRLINFRSFLVILTFLILSIFIALLAENNFILGIILFLCLLISLIVTALVLYIKSCESHKTISIVIAFFLCLFVFINFSVTSNNWNKLVVNRSYQIVGKVTEHIQKSNDEIILYIDNAKADKEKIGGIMKITITDYDKNGIAFVKCGDVLSFSSVVYPIKLTDGIEVNGTAYRQNLKYSCFVEAKNLTMLFGKPSFFQGIRIKLHDLLLKNLGSKYGEISYSMLIGDKFYLNDYITDYFSVSGLGHIMAVSGLHIGFLTLVIGWILNKLKLNKKIIIAITSFILLFYMTLVGFSPSVVRAVLMSIVGMITLLNGMRKDVLNSLCFALSIILLIKPFYLFEIGFIMSFSAVYGIILFSKAIEKGTKRFLHFPNFLAKPFSVSASAQFGITPAIIFFFNQIQVMSILVNVILMPVIMITFIGLMISAVLAFFIPFLGLLLKLPKLGLTLIDFVSQFVATLPFASFMMFSFILIFISYILFFVASRFVMFQRFKSGISAICIVLCLTLVFIGNTKSTVDFGIIPINSSNEVTSVVWVDKKAYLIGDISNYNNIVYTLNDMRISKLNGIIVNIMDESKTETIFRLSKRYKIKTVYCYMSKDVSGIVKLLENRIDVVLINEFEDIKLGVAILKPKVVEDKFYGYNLEVIEKNIFLSNYGSNYEKLPTVYLTEVDIIRNYLYLNYLPDRIFITNLPKNFLGQEPIFQFSVHDDGNFIFDYKFGVTKKLKKFL